MNSLCVRCPHNKDRLEDEAAEPTPKRQRLDQVDTGSSSSSVVVNLCLPILAVGPRPEDAGVAEGGRPAQPFSPISPIAVAARESCDWTGNYADLLSTHMRRCRFWSVSCPAGCGEQMMRKDVAAHETICPRIVVACPICQELVKDLDAHQADPETKDRHLQLLLRKVADLENSR